MLSYSTFGRHGLGNQLFEYAFLRSTARRLGTTFYCPPWLGDRIFMLDDGDERAPTAAGIRHSYMQPVRSCGFDELSVAIGNDTEIYGYFQSSRFWPHPDEVRRWFRFRPETVVDVAARHRDRDLARCTRLHIRMGDDADNVRYYQPSLGYYRRALACAGAGPVLVFTDDVARARHALRRLASDLTFIEGNAAHEDLYLMSRCGAHVCSASTFSWWGAWLTPHARAAVIVPREGATRPGNPVTARHYWEAGWTALRALRPVVDGYRLQASLRSLSRRVLGR